MYSYKNETKLSFEQMLEIEKNIYDNEIYTGNPTNVICNVETVLKRKVCRFSDKEYNMPQNIFLIKGFDGHIIVGRKLRSVLHIENKINAINCSMITSDMLIGILYNKGQIDRDVWVEYFPFHKEEKKSIFDKIKLDNQIEIIYPFIYRDFYTGLEEVTSKDGWDIFPEKVKYLGYGEEHLRDYSIKVIDQYISSNKDKKNIIMFDPACSTGQFLYSVKKVYPQIKTIGQDLSIQMVNYARKYVDEIYYGDSITTTIKDKSIDIIVFRFLNSEVVSQAYAKKLFKVLIKKISDNGIAILIGHTPILLNSTDFNLEGYDIVQSCGYSEYRDSIFQYYILKRRIR